MKVEPLHPLPLSVYPQALPGNSACVCMCAGRLLCIREGLMTSRIIEKQMVFESHGVCYYSHVLHLAHQHTYSLSCFLSLSLSVDLWSAMAVVTINPCLFLCLHKSTTTKGWSRTCKEHRGQLPNTNSSHTHTCCLQLLHSEPFLRLCAYIQDYSTHRSLLRRWVPQRLP